jgi:hypothetical protein
MCDALAKLLHVHPEQMVVPQVDLALHVGALVIIQIRPDLLNWMDVHGYTLPSISRLAS